MKATSGLLLSAVAALAVTQSCQSVRIPTGDEISSNCSSKTYHISIETNRTVFDTQVINQTDQIQTTDILLTGALHPERVGQAVKGVESFRATYAVHGTYCSPSAKSSPTTLQILVHGIGFDSSYWDFHGPGVASEGYSYTTAATKRGIPTFRFDRIGAGLSQRPSDGINDVQGAVEAAILAKLVTMAKRTTQIGAKRWSKVVVVGHSYGSILAHAVSRQAPTLIDGLLLTGFSANSTAIPYYLLASNFLIANEARPAQFGKASSNWLVTGTSVGRQIAFLYPPTVASPALELFSKKEQPVSLGTFFTISSLFRPANEYTNAVLIVLGQKDFLFALQENSEGKAVYTAKSLYPNASNASTLTPINTGHAINVHNTAQTVFSAMFEFLSANGLS